MKARVVHVPREAAAWTVSRDWARLDELCLGIWDCPHSTPVLTESGPLVVRSQDIRTGVFKYHEAAHVSEKTYKERIARAEPTFGDILYSREGTYFGIAAEMPSDHRVCLGQRMVLIRPDPALANTRFLRLWLNSPVLSRHIHGFRDGTVAERLNMPTIRGLPFPIVPLDEQDAIADLLGSLDDKIELNRRMNETLEAMAQAIFRDWFVDFGPTRRKMAGATDPVAIMGGLTPDAARAEELAAMFPDALNDEGLPDGWIRGKLGDVADSASDGVDPANIDPETPYIGLEHMPRRSIALADWDAAAKVSSNKSRFRRGQVLFGKLRPYFHKVGVAPVDGVCSTDIVVLDARRSEWRSFVVACASSDAFVAHTDQTSTGTKMPRTSWGIMRQYPTVKEPRALIEAFGVLVDPIIEKITTAIHESRTLADTRDLLLPKLMSGEVRLVRPANAN